MEKITNVTVNGVGFNAESAVQKGLELFKKEQAHQWPELTDKKRNERLEEAFKACKIATTPIGETETN